MIKITNPFLRWGISALLALLILFGTYHSIFSLAAFLGCCLMIFFCDRESTLLQLFFVMPMANIFKMSPGSQSFFTILLLAYVVLHLVLPRKATTLIILFGLYVVLGELIVGSFNLFRTIKLICNILFLSSALNSNVKIRHKEIFLSFIVGSITASVFRLLNSDIFRIDSYVKTIELGYGIAFEENLTRFAGLYSDPNYYSVGMVISLCLIVLLWHRKEIHGIFAAVLSAAIVYFLIQTYSKSAVMMLAVMVMFFMYSLFIKRKYAGLLIFCSALVLLVVLILSGSISALDIIIERFEKDVSISGEVNVDSLTTGRTTLWMQYLGHLISNIEYFFFGKSIVAGYIGTHVAHSTYIDILYHLGVLGGSLLIGSLITISEQSRQVRIRRNLLNYSVLICVMIMYTFLSELFYFDPPFQLFLAIIVLNLPLENKIYKTDLQILTNKNKGDPV